MPRRKKARYGREMRARAADLFEAGLGFEFAAKKLDVPAPAVRKWLYAYRATGRKGLIGMGEGRRTYDMETKLAVARAVVDGGDAAVGGDGPLRHRRRHIARPLVQAVPRGRAGGARAGTPRQAGGPRGADARAGARGARAQTRGPGGVSKKIDSPESGEELSNWEKAQVVASLSGHHRLCDLLAAARLAPSSYHYAVAHPPRATRPELREAVREIFSRTANGCGHRQIAMCLRAELGARIADKTVLKMMRELGIRCGIRRETDYHRYNSYRGPVGERFDNLIARDFRAGAPWEKLGTDVTEFRQPWGKAYFAPVYDFCTKEIVSWSVSTSPDMAQQEEVLRRLFARMPAGASPIVHSDMGWQYQHPRWTGELRRHGARQSMSRKGNCLDNGATEQVFGHLKDEFFRGVEWADFESFKRDLDAYVVHWNTRRRQVALGGLTTVEFRKRLLKAS